MNVNRPVTARANNISENENSTPLLEDTTVPEAHMLSLVLTKDQGRADVCPYSDRSLITRHVKNILKEMLQNEGTYVQTLDRGIKDYLSIKRSKELPPGLRGQWYHIFGNIETIHRLHRDQLLPKLERNQASIQGIAETFIHFLEHDKFYCYIIYVMNRSKSERIRNRNEEFFQLRQAEVDDKLGMESFLIQPIQRLPRYKLLLAEINKEILKQSFKAIKDEIDIICKAEKRLERFIKIVDEAMNINDIQECYEIDLFHQGKFRKMLEVDIYDLDRLSRYPAKMFLFEWCIIYTEKCETHLECRGWYDYKEIGLYTEDNMKVYMFARERGIQDIEVYCSDTNEGQWLSDHVKGMMTQFTIIDRKPMLEDTSVQKQQQDEVDQFNSRSFDSDSDDEPFPTSGYIRPESDRSLITNRVKCILQELLQNEANYVQTLGRGIENYVSIMGSKELPPGLRGQRYHIFGNIEKIHRLHRDQLLPMLERNQASIHGIAETFIRFLEHDKFYCYIMFALNRPKSERICNRNLDFFQRRQDDVNDKLGLSSFLLQPIQRLPRYKLLLAEINKEILKHMEKTLLEAVKDEIAILCKAEKRLERFINIFNEAMSINDIQECYEIDLFHQGKFRKMLEVDIYDLDRLSRYPAKMFLFEWCVIYTEKCKTHLGCRGWYDYSEIGLYSESRNKVYLFAEERGIQEIEVYCNDMNEEQWLSDHVKVMMTIPKVPTSRIGRARKKRESTSQVAWDVHLN